VWSTATSGELVNLGAALYLRAENLGGYYVRAYVDASTSFTLSGPYAAQADAVSAMNDLVSHVKK
jgi:hypothetical protein